MFKNNYKYTNRLRDRYYKCSRTAIASHSLRGEFNPNGLSRYLTDEISMPSEDRKNFVLPCGYTIAQSWAALRKCWKGFYIARSRNDSDKMAEYASRIRKLRQEIGIQGTDFDEIPGAQDPNETRANSCRFVYSKNQNKAHTVNSCRYVRPKERIQNCDYKIVSSSNSISPRDLGRRSPGEDFFSKSRLETENFCHFSSKKDGNRSDRQTDPGATWKPTTQWYVNPGDQFDKFYSTSENIDGTDHKADLWATQNPTTIWYVNPGNTSNRHDSEGTMYDEGNACYYGSSKSEPQKEDENIIRRRRRKSCTYKHNTFD